MWKVRLLHEVLIARQAGRVIGYCQWEGEHFGPFGVRADARNAKVVKLFVEAVHRICAADGRTGGSTGPMKRPHGSTADTV